MLQTRLGAILLLIGSCFAQLELKCPTDWVEYSGTCYKFSRSPVKQWVDARFTCQSYGADLLAVGSPEEHSFIQNWLQVNDPQRKEWYTSGADIQGSNTWRWESDRTILGRDVGWIPHANAFGQAVVYSYSFNSNEWGWNAVDKETPRPYICEAPLEEVPTLKIIDRATDYGIIVAEPNLVPRGPSFEVQPQDTIFDESARDLIDDVTLKCIAEGYPYPQYKWFRLVYQQEHLEKSEIEILGDKRYTLTNGILTISAPDQTKDRGQYFCEAANIYGKIRSNTVQLAFGYVRDFQIKRDPVIANLYSGIGVPCDPPPHFPELIYYWTRTFPNFVEENQRVFVSYDGHLYISTVEFTDASNYSCNIKSSISAAGKTGPVFSLIVEKEQSFGQLLIQTSFPKMFPEAPLAGNNVRIECVANGYPVPTYNWTRIGYNKLPANAELKSYNRVLQIKNIQIEDSGDYVCTAFNTRGAVTTKITLDIKAKPIFTVPLQDMIVDIDSDVELLCEAYGRPDLQYIWYKNSIETFNLPEEERDNMKVKSNTLTINKAKEKNNAMYQCEAKNLLGSTFSSAQLKVISMAPSFAKYPLQPLTYAAETQNATIVCTPEAAPKPIIKWLKGFNELPAAGRFKVLPNGNLHIERIELRDAGTYTCVAENRLGRAQSSGVLIVRRLPMFNIRPQTSSVIINNTAVLMCEAVADPALDLTYAWNFNQIKINFDIVQDEFQQGNADNPSFDRGLLRIVNVSFAESGIYRCIAKTTIASIYSDASLTVVGPPGPPSGVTAKDVVNSRATVQWNDGTNNGATIVSYRIEARNSYRKVWELLVENPKVKSIDSQKEAQVLNLSPYNSYEFRVSARNEYGFGDSSIASQSYSTPRDKPYKTVANIGGGGGKEGDLSITWEPLLPEDQNGPGIAYYVFYRKEEDTTMKFEKKKVIDSDRIFTVHVGQMYIPYLVKVMAVNDAGDGPESQPVRIFSAESTPTDAPQHVLATAYNSTAINVTWDPLINTRDRMRGELRGHRIKYWRADQTEGDARFVLLNGTRNWGLVIGLQNFTNYWIKVFAFNTAGNGPESEQVRERTLKSAVETPPTFVQIKDSTPSSVVVIWRGVVPSEYEEPIDGYRIRYWPERIDMDKAEIRDFSLNYFKDKEDMEASINDLIPGEVYNLRVSAYSRGGDGRMSNPATRFKTVGFRSNSLHENHSSHPFPSLISHLFSLLVLLYIFHPKH